jgi:oxygen-independent coproporphyrinogen-3 oxidase
LRRPYTGIGAGAHSFDGASRWWNERDLDRYLASVEAGELPVAGRETLDEPTRAFEAVALGLRQIAGLDRVGFRLEFGTDPVERYADAMATGQASALIEIDARRVRLTSSGRLLANEALVGFAPAR